MVLGRNLFELWIKNHIQITFGKTWTYSSFHVTLFSWNLILHAKNSNITSKLHFMASMNNYITSLNQMYPNQSTSTYTHAHIYLFWCFLVKVHDLVLTTLVKLIKHLGCYTRRRASTRGGAVWRQGSEIERREWRKRGRWEAERVREIPGSRYLRLFCNIVLG